MSLLDRRFQLDDARGGTGLSCNAQGLWLAGRPLLRRTISGYAPRPADEIAALTKCAYGRDMDPEGLVAGLRVIAEALDRGDLGRAMVGAVHLRLPALDENGAARIAIADDTLAKFDPNEPRDALGRWTNGGDQIDADHQSAPDGPPPRRDRALSGGSRVGDPAASASMGATILTINGVSGLKFRVMPPDETGAQGIGELAEVAGSIQQLPAHILSNLQARGVHWIVVPDSADRAFPDENLTDRQPEGWNPAGTAPDARPDWGDVSSQYNPAHNAVVVGTPENDADGSFNVSLHETGHAYDETNRGGKGHAPLSQQSDFQAAYAADRLLMTPPDRATPDDPSDAYFLQPNGVGAREAFAESFARHYGGDKTLEDDWPHMDQYWKQRDAALAAAARPTAPSSRAGRRR